ncbi:AAA family ATPase [Niveibacterium terrae]|uniref:bifunctional aminoglycoside phosphotransferase/ATP-binding protein n=1 Tax=Niveibacterium terrae TaxID=3373598 RepID=UPI003A906750
MAGEASLASQRRLVEALCDPARYPHPVGTVELIETHISFVLLAGAFAYKIKKAVDLGFVDYLSLERRRFFCVEELRLNARLAPALYLEVCAIGRSAAEPCFGEEGEAIEYAVKMRRFEQSDLFEGALADGRLKPVLIEALARRLAAFHAEAGRTPPGTDFGRPDVVWTQVGSCLAALKKQPGIDPSRLKALDAWCRGENERCREALARRKADGFIRECHGDLHLGNLVLHGGEALAFDGIEFNASLRWIDVISDLAFAVMDFAAHGRADLGWRLLDAWLEEGGDFASLELLRFYQVYRALVRAEVACLRGASPEAYLDCAEALSVPAKPFLLITHGFSASGKSRLARALVSRLGAIRLRSDVERKRAAGLAPLARSGSSPDSGLYTEEATQQAYRRLRALAEFALAQGYPVIVDAACLKTWQRRLFFDLAREKDLPFAILDCQAPAGDLRQRLAARARRGRDASEATLEVLAGQREGAEAFDDAEMRCVLVADTGGRSDALDAVLVRQIAERVKAF